MSVKNWNKNASIYIELDNVIYDKFVKSSNNLKIEQNYKTNQPLLKKFPRAFQMYWNVLGIHLLIGELITIIKHRKDMLISLDFSKYQSTIIIL